MGLYDAELYKMKGTRRRIYEPFECQILRLAGN
jgi:hypothetical protein